MPEKKILIVEDEVIIAMNTQNMLEINGFDVIGTASTGKQAIELALRFNPDLILMDIILSGGMDGIDTYIKIKERCDVPIIYQTAHSDPATFSRAKATHPHGYLLKPVGERDLLSAIEVALERDELEKKLKDSEARFRTQFLVSPLPILIWKREGDDFILLDRNPAAVNIIDSRAENLTGKKAEYIFRDRPDVLAEFEKCYSSRETRTGKIEYTFVGMGAMKIFIYTMVFLSPDMVMLYLEDVTDKEKVKEALSGFKKEYALTFERRITDLKPGDHLCLLYENDQELMAFLCLYCRQALNRNEKIIYAVDNFDVDSTVGALRNDGIDIDRYLESGRISVLPCSEVYMPDGVFIFDRMVELLEAETKNMREEGYSALCLAGSAAWSLHGGIGSENLIEYEAAANLVYSRKPCTAACMYDMRKFDSETLINVLRTHPIVIKGNEVYDNIFYVPAENAGGRNKASVEFDKWLQNLSENREIKERLQSSENTARALLNTPFDSIILLNNKGVILDINETALERMGRKSEEIIGKSALEVLPPEVAEARSNHLMNVLETGETVRYEDERKGAWFDHVVCPIFDDRKEIERVAIIARDITEKKRLHGELLNERERLNNILSSLKTGLALINPDMTVAWVNDLILEMLPGRDPVGLHCYEYFESRTEPCEDCGTKRAFENGGVYNSVRFNSENNKWLQLVSQPVKDSEGNVTQVLVSVSDITEYRQAEPDS